MPAISKGIAALIVLIIFYLFLSLWSTGTGGIKPIMITRPSQKQKTAVQQQRGNQPVQQFREIPPASYQYIPDQTLPQYAPIPGSLPSSPQN